MESFTLHFLTLRYKKATNFTKLNGKDNHFVSALMYYFG